MIKKFQMRFWQFVERCQQSGVKSALAKTTYIGSIVVPARKKLGSVASKLDILHKKGMSFIEITPENAPNTEVVYSLRSRQIKKTVNTAKGYRNFAMIAGRKVIADVWCALPGTTNHPNVHPDANKLGIQIGKKDVYIFDAYIRPDQRGKALVTPFLLTCLATLKEKGYEYAYGGYELNNIPARWMHLLLKMEELPHRRVSKVIFHRTSAPVKKDALEQQA